ncbi:MAG: hypothetical protein HS120_11445 [Burkholderiales bacterium]|nr:hypothetical protein [Burkholderiales bacterium]
MGYPRAKQITRQANIAHRPVNIAAGQRVDRKHLSCSRMSMLGDSRLKQWMKKFHGVATRYLGNYLGCMND